MGGAMGRTVPSPAMFRLLCAAGAELGFSAIAKKQPFHL